MATAKIEPHMVMADAQGNIYDDPDLLMVCRRSEEWGTPRPDELMPLPEESELFLLPGRRAVGLNPETGEIECTEDLAVAAFAAPAHTLSAHPTQTNPSRTGTESVTMNDLDPEADVPVIEAVWLVGVFEPPLALYSRVAVNVCVVRSHTA